VATLGELQPGPSAPGRCVTCWAARGCWWPTTWTPRARRVCRATEATVAAYAPHSAALGQGRDGVLAGWRAGTRLGSVRVGAAACSPKLAAVTPPVRPVNTAIDPAAVSAHAYRCS
jgi:hypothetical protein